MAEEIFEKINYKLNLIIKEVNGISNEIDISNEKIENLTRSQSLLETTVSKLNQAFTDFIEEDSKQKMLQLAETRQGNLKQDLQLKFGYYAEVRRMATGIFHSVDAGLVSDDTLRFTMEEMMLKAPRYWLAPALVGLAAWIRNKPETVKNALAESIKRNDYKTTLFFMLAMRRLGRMDACLKWLKRYFSLQNPHSLGREFIIVIEAVATGILPPASREFMNSSIKEWIAELTKTDDYVNSQKANWIVFFASKCPQTAGDYPNLTRYATNWSALENVLREAKVHEILYGFFQQILAESSDYTKEITSQLDEILNLLVTNFDDEELPLQKDLRLNELIIQMEGDRTAALGLMDTENSMFEEKVDFLQLLSNASFNPELAGASKVTQLLAVLISKDWILEAHQTYTANSRNLLPANIELDLAGFQITTDYGQDEEELLKKHHKYWVDFTKNAISKVQYPGIWIIIGLCLLIIGIISLSPQVGFGGFVIFLGLVSIISSKILYDNKIADVKSKIADMKASSLNNLKVCIAEAVDYRKELDGEDKNAGKFQRLLARLSKHDFASVSKGTKNILT